MHTIYILHILMCYTTKKYITIIYIFIQFKFLSSCAILRDIYFHLLNLFNQII